MERLRKMREKKKMEVKSIIFDKIMDIVKKLENNIQISQLLWIVRVKINKY